MRDISFLLKSSAVVFIVQVVAVWPILNIFLGGLQDEGGMLVAADRIHQGELPYRDFTLRFMPASFYILSWAFALFGQQIWVARVYFLVSMGLLAVVIWWLSLRLLPPLWAALPVLFFACVGGHFWPMATCHWDSTLAALISLLLFTAGPERKYAFAAGIFAGLTVLFLQPRGVAVILAVAAVALSQAPRLQRLGLTVAGAAVPGVLFSGWLLYHGIFGAFWEQAVVYNLATYTETQAYPFQWSLSLHQAQLLVDGLQKIGSIPFSSWLGWFLPSLGFALVDLVKYTLFLPLCAVLGLVIWRAEEQSEKRSLLLGLLTLLVVSAFLNWARATRYHFNFFTPYFYPVVVYLCWRIRDYKEKITQCLAAVMLLGFLLHGWSNYRSWGAYKYPVRFARGLLYADHPATALMNQNLNDALSQRYSEQRLFGFPDLALIQWLSGTRNPTSFDVLAPLFYPDELFLEARKELEAAAPVGILFRPIGSALPGNYPNVSVSEYQAAEDRQLKLLTEGAELVEQIGDFSIYHLDRTAGTP